MSSDFYYFVIFISAVRSMSFYCLHFTCTAERARRVKEGSAACNSARKRGCSNLGLERHPMVNWAKAPPG